MGTDSKTRGISFSALGRFPVLRFLLPLASGIVAGRYAGCVSEQAVTVSWIAVVALALLLAILAISNKRWVENLGFFITTVLFFFILGFAASSDALVKPRYPWAEKKTAYGGVVTSCPVLRERVARFRIRVAEVYERGVFHRVNRNAEITVLRSKGIDTLKSGDAVMIYAKMAEPRNAGNPYEFDYASYLKLHGVGGTAFVFADDVVPLSSAQSARLRGQCLGLGDRVMLWGENIRLRLMRLYRNAGLEGDFLAVVSAMTLGEKSHVSRRMRDVFSHTGTSHVLALSGLHLGIIFSLLQYLLTFGGRFSRMRVPAQVAIILFVWFYAVVAGMPVSLVRASVMCTLVCMSALAGGNPLSEGNLYLAAFLILLFAPLSLFDVGFQMSFVSVLSILKLMPFVAPPRVIASSPAGKLWAFMAVSLCAQAGVAALVAYHFHNFPTYFMLSNLVVVPMATVIVSLSFALAALSWLHPVAVAVGWLLKTLLRFQFSFLDFAGSLPGASLTFYPSLPTVAVLCVALLLLFGWVASRKRIYLIFMATVIVAAIAVQTITATSACRPGSVWFYGGTRVSAAQFVVSSCESYLYSPATESDEAVWHAMTTVSHDYWARCGMSRPVRLHDGFESRYAKFYDGLLLFGNRTFLFLDASTPRHDGISTVKVDAVFVSRGFKGNLQAWLEKVKSDLVVLDTGISAARRTKFLRECRKSGVRVHDLDAQGALEMPIDRHCAAHDS